MVGGIGHAIGSVTSTVMTFLSHQSMSICPVFRGSSLDSQMQGFPHLMYLVLSYLSANTNACWHPKNFLYALKYSKFPAKLSKSAYSTSGVISFNK